MADLATYQMPTSGALPSFVAAAASDSAEVGSGRDTFAVYRNTTASPVTVTVVLDRTLDSGDAYPNKEFTLAATTGELWIPLIKDYADPDTPGRCNITTSAQDPGITVAIVRR